MGQFLGRLGGRQDREVLKEQRQVVGQFLGLDLQPLRFVTVAQVNHRLAAVTAFPVDVFEQMERQRPAPIEQRDISSLAVEQVVVGQSLDQWGQRRALIRCQQAVLGQQRRKYRRGLLNSLVRIAQQRGEDTQGRVHQNTSEGVWSFLRAGAPNRLAPLVPPEQPLPSEKPQPPRSSYMSSATSRWPLGMTKRSS